MGIELYFTEGPFTCFPDAKEAFTLLAQTHFMLSERKGYGTEMKTPLGELDVTYPVISIWCI